MYRLTSLLRCCLHPRRVLPADQICYHGFHSTPAVLFEGRLDTADAPSMIDIGIREIFTEDHDIFRRSVRRFFQEESAPHHNKWEAQGYVDREVWVKAGKQSLLGICTPSELGGQGGDFLYDTIVAEEQYYSKDLCCGFPLHNQVCTPYFSAYATRAQAERYMPGILSGELIMAIAMTEPGAGSDLQGIRTQAKKDGDDWILNGSKTFITNGILADLVLVVAVTHPEAKSFAHGLSIFLVDAGLKGFTKGRNLEKMGLKGNDTAELFFDDVRLSADSVLGQPGQGFYYLMNQLSTERLSIAILSVAMSELTFEETRNYVRQRKAFGKTLSALQTVQHKLAEMKTEICMCRVFVDRCISLKNEDNLSVQMASMAKYWCSDLVKRVTDQCVQLHGGWGYMMEMPVAKAFLGARLQTIYGGANEIMKELIAREIVQK